MSDNYQEKETEETREKILFAWYPFKVPIKCCKFIWFKKIKVTQIRVLYRWTEFDDGWTYQLYWSKWHDRWDTISVEIVK